MIVPLANCTFKLCENKGSNLLDADIISNISTIPSGSCETCSVDTAVARAPAPPRAIPPITPAAVDSPTCMTPSTKVLGVLKTSIPFIALYTTLAVISTASCAPSVIPSPTAAEPNPLTKSIALLSNVLLITSSVASLGTSFKVCNKNLFNRPVLPIALSKPAFSKYAAAADNPTFIVKASIFPISS